MEETELKRTWILLSILSLFIFLAGCQKPAAIVNGDKISKDELSKALAQRVYANTARGIVAEKKTLEKSVLEELITQKILMQEALRRQITVSDKEVEDEYNKVLNRNGKERIENAFKATNTSVKDFKETIRRTICINKLTVLNAPVVTDDEAKVIYKQNPGSFVRPESAKVRVILASTNEEGLELVSKIKKDGFDTVADYLEKGGKASPPSWVGIESVDPEMKSAVKSLRPGAFGGPYKGPDGFYIIRVLEKKPKGQMSFEEAKEGIKAQLQAAKVKEDMARLISDLRSKADIKINI